jgi:hypothetical protein
VALVSGVAALAVILGAVAVHHPAFHFAIHFRAAFMLTLTLGVLPLLVRGLLRSIVLRMVDGSSGRCLRRCERNGCDKHGHSITPKFG